MNTFKKIVLNDWRQFDNIDIDLSKQVTILTGQNGSGKTTILNVLSKHFGWNLNFISTLQVSKKKEKKFWTHLKKYLFFESEPTNTMVGYVEYDDENRCDLIVPQRNSPKYQLEYNNLRQVVGLNIPSDRPTVSYHQLDNIPADPKSTQQQYQNYQQLLMQLYGSANVRNPGLVLKQSLVSLALFGYGNEAVLPNYEYIRLFEDFQDKLRKILPKDIGFQRIEVQIPEVTLITDSGNFSLDAMSGGINSLFSIVWQIHIYGADKQNCTVTIDEPENHLHPSMQRTFIPSLAEAFPRYKFIISTHSPFIISSMPAGNVYGLISNSNKRIDSLKIEEPNLSGSANKILREILDVQSTLPIWVEKSITDIISRTENENPEVRARLIFEELDRLGISDQISNFEFNK